MTEYTFIVSGTEVCPFLVKSSVKGAERFCHHPRGIAIDCPPTGFPPRCPLGMYVTIVKRPHGTVKCTLRPAEIFQT